SGAPSSRFGGAAQNPGYWNRVLTGGVFPPANLAALDGDMTSVQLHTTGNTGSGGGGDHPPNNREKRPLLKEADETTPNTEIDYHLTGLASGRYRVFTYAVDPIPTDNYSVDTYVTVPGAVESTQDVTGPMPGNQFILGVTHCIHDITIDDGDIDIDVSG